MKNKQESLSIILKELDGYRAEITTIQADQNRLLKRSQEIEAILEEKKIVLDEILSGINSTTH